MGQRTHMTWTNATYMITANATEVYRPPERKTCVYNIRSTIQCKDRDANEERSRHEVEGLRK